MKITISKAEMLRVMSEHFRIEVTEVVISKNNSAVVDNFLTKMAKEMGTTNITEGMLGGANKIPAIKALRTVTSYGLAEAKWAVENWGAYIKAYTKFGRQPKIEGNCMSYGEGPKLL